MSEQVTGNETTTLRMCENYLAKQLRKMDKTEVKLFIYHLTTNNIKPDTIQQCIDYAKQDKRAGIK